MNQLTRVQTLFFLIAGLLVISGVCLRAFESVIDINVHDTYLVIDQGTICYVAAAGLGFIGMIYLMFVKIKKPLNSVMGYIHLLLSFLPLVVFVISTVTITPSGRLYAEEDIEIFALFLGVSVFMAIVGQALFVINIIYTLLRKKVN